MYSMHSFKVMKIIYVSILSFNKNNISLILYNFLFTIFKNNINDSSWLWIDIHLTPTL